MFIVSIDYIVDFKLIDPLIDEHFTFLKKYYERGVFVMSGRKQPRTGGVILARNCTLDTLESLIQEDPFHREGVATYTIIEFIASSVATGLEMLAE